MTRPLFGDVENVASEGPFLLLGNHQLFALQDVPWAEREDDPEALAECRDLVKSEIEAHIEDLLGLRASDPHRNLLPGAVHTIRTALRYRPYVRPEMSEDSTHRLSGLTGPSRVSPCIARIRTTR